MSYIEADCSLIKKDGELIGLSLVAQPQAEAEFFCASFPRQLVDGKGDIEIKGGVKVTFIDPKEGSVSFSIEFEDATALQELLSGNGKLEIHPDGILTPGFKITREGMKDEGEKSQIDRIV